MKDDLEERVHKAFNRMASLSHETMPPNRCRHKNGTSLQASKNISKQDKNLSGSNKNDVGTVNFSTLFQGKNKTHPAIYRQHSSSFRNKYNLEFYHIFYTFAWNTLWEIAIYWFLRMLFLFTNKTFYDIIYKD